LLPNHAQSEIVIRSLTKLFAIAGCDWAYAG